MTFAETAWDYFEVETNIQSLLVWNLQQFCETYFPKKINSIQNKLLSDDCRNIICQLSFVESLKSIYIDSIEKICSYLVTNLFKQKEEDHCEDGTISSDDCCSESESDENGNIMCCSYITIQLLSNHQNVILTTNILEKDILV